MGILYSNENDDADDNNMLDDSHNLNNNGSLKLIDSRYVEMIKYDEFLIIKSELIAQMYTNMMSEDLIFISSNGIGTDMHIEAPDVIIKDNGNDKSYLIPISIISDLQKDNNKSLNIGYKLYKPFDYIRGYSEEVIITNDDIHKTIKLRRFNVVDHTKDIIVFKLGK